MYTKYTWIGNRISTETMATLYRLKLKTRTPITKLVAKAVSEYLERQTP